VHGSGNLARSYPFRRTHEKFMPVDQDNDREKVMQKKSRRLNALIFWARFALALAFIALTTLGQSSAQDYDAPTQNEADQPIPEPQPDISLQRVALILARRGYRLEGTFPDRGDYIVASGVDARGRMEKFIIDPYDGEVIRSWRVEPAFAHDGSTELTHEPSVESVGQGNDGPYMGAPALEQRGPPEEIGHDGYGSQYAPAPTKPHEISNEIRAERSRRHVGRTLLEPFKLPEEVDPFAPGPGIAARAGLSSQRKSFEQLGVRPVSKSGKTLVNHTVPPLSPLRANKMKTAPATAALNARNSAQRLNALPLSTTTPRSTTAPERGSNPVTGATALPVKVVTPPSPIFPALAPVPAESSQAQMHDSTRSSTQSRPIEKPRSIWITNEAAPKSNINR
jgi:hypothetical protein